VRHFSGKGWRWGIAALVLGLTVAATRAQFNTGGGSGAPINNPTRPGEMDRMRMPDEEPYATREIQARQMKRLREEHQKEVFTDTNKLVQLATSLKREVDKGNAATLDVIKNADEIGKLAKRVSERIKTQ
jgi:hypothetical protein